MDHPCRSLSVSCAAALLLATSGCASRLAVRGQEAFDRGDYAQALVNYEAAARDARGSEESEVPGLEAEAKKSAERWAQQQEAEAGRLLAAGAESQARTLVRNTLLQIQLRPRLNVEQGRLVELLETIGQRHWAAAQVAARQKRYYAAWYLGFEHTRGLPDGHPWNKELYSWLAQAGELHRARAKEAQQRKLAGAEALNLKLATLAGGKEDGAELREQVRTQATPDWQFSMSGTSCAGMEEALPKLAAPERGTPARATVEVALCSAQERPGASTTEEYTYQEPVTTYVEVSRQECKDEGAGNRPVYDPIQKKPVMVPHVQRVCRTVTERVPTVTYVSRTATRKVDHIFTTVQIKATVKYERAGSTWTEGFAFSDTHDDQRYTSRAGDREFSGDGAPYLRTQAGRRLGKQMQDKLSAISLELQNAQLERAKVALGANDTLEAEEALLRAVALGAAPPKELLDKVPQLNGLTSADAISLLGTKELPVSDIGRVPLVEMPSPQRPLPFREVVSFEPNEHLDALANMFAAGRYSSTPEPLAASSIALTVGVTGFGYDRESPLSLAYDWGIEAGLDQHVSFLFDARAGVGPAFTLWRLTLAPVALVGVDRLPVHDFTLGDGSALVPIGLFYGGGARFYAELGDEVAFEADGAWLWRTGEHGERRAGARLVFLDDDRNATFFGVRYGDYEIARSFALLLGYGD